MAVRIRSFSGVAPALTPWKLPPGMAQVALNINPDSRTVKPWRDAVVASAGYALGTTTTIFRFGRSLISDVEYWFQWAFDVDVVKGPIVGDATERTFYTGDGAPKWTNNTLALTGGPPYPAAYRDLGMVRPVNPPVMSVTGTAASQDYVIVGYAYTVVSPYGEESAPSPICDGQKVYSGQTASLSNFDPAPVGTGSASARRLYRSVTSSTDTNLYFVKEFGPTDLTAVDDVGTNIGEVIQTATWDPPPATMFGIVAMANGIMVGFDGYDVLPSAQYAPYAYPKEYRLSTDFPIIGGCAVGTQVLVFTMGNPYILSGTTPDALSLTKIESPEACVSKRSIVNITSAMPSLSATSVMAGTVYYASQNGLCACDASGNVINVLNGIMNRDDWQALNPRSINGFTYNGRYFGFFDTGEVQGGFCFDPRGAESCLTFFSFYATGGFYDIAQDHLLLQVSSNIVLWNAADQPLTATWRSGVIETPPQTWWGAKVRAADYNETVTFRLYGDGALIWEETVADARTFRLPCDDDCEQWEIEIETTTEVYEVILAQSTADLKAAEVS